MGRNQKPDNRHKGLYAPSPLHFTGMRRGKRLRRKSGHRARDIQRKAHINKYLSRV